MGCAKPTPILRPPRKFVGGVTARHLLLAATMVTALAVTVMDRTEEADTVIGATIPLLLLTCTHHRLNPLPHPSTKEATLAATQRLVTRARGWRWPSLLRLFIFMDAPHSRTMVAHMRKRVPAGHRQ